MNEIVETIIEQASNSSWLEVTAVVFGLLSVWYSLKENILVYPTGIISVLIYIYITYQYQLYGDMGINGYYFVMSVYGWYYWTSTQNDDDQIPIAHISKQESFISAVFFFGSFGLLSWFLQGFTNSDVPYWDALTTSLALVGMWLMARKKIEHWWAWILCDIISVPLYYVKGLPYTSFQFLVFSILAIWGYFEWKRKLRTSQAVS
ncbi:MAG: nicotinamide riboside transporter PnuC [Cyclobacteriaceae bacterium]